MKQLLMVLVLVLFGLMATGQETAAALGERFQKTRAPADKLAWYQALEREGHDFSKRVRTAFVRRWGFCAPKPTWTAS